MSSPSAGSGPLLRFGVHRSYADTRRKSRFIAPRTVDGRSQISQHCSRHTQAHLQGARRAFAYGTHLGLGMTSLLKAVLLSQINQHCSRHTQAHVQGARRACLGMTSLLKAVLLSQIKPDTQASMGHLGLCMTSLL